MLYFKHSELADKYHVSLKTVHNWIDAAKQNKLKLNLHEHGSRIYIANNPNNITLLENLASEGKKYRNTRFNKTVNPLPEFYNTYSRRQALDIISNLTIHREIPNQYNYVDDGAYNWDSWVQRLSKEDKPNNLNNTRDLMRANLESIDKLIGSHTRVNILDIGVGNAYPVKELLEHLMKQGILHRYIAIDISQTMLDIAEKNINSWFGGQVKFEGHVRDISYERFDDLLVDDMLDKDSEKTFNMALLLGATPVNFRTFSDILKCIYGSMGENDVLAYTGKPDSEASRRYFDFHPTSGNATVSPINRYTLDLLGVDDSLYDVEMGYDGQKRMRYVRVRLKSSIIIKFKFADGEKQVRIEKGESILVLRVWHMSALEIISEFEKAGFILLESHMTKDRERLLTISGIDTKSMIANPA